MTTNETNHSSSDTTAQETRTRRDEYVDLAGVTAEKSVRMTDEDIHRITFDINSTRPEPVHVEIRDQLPENFPLDGVAFHPDYDRENWSIENGQEVVYESTVEPQSNLRTVYAVKPDELSDPSTILTETEIDAAIDGEPTPEQVASESSPTIDETEPSDPSSDHQREENEASADGSEEVNTFELADPNEESQVPPQSKASVAEDTIDGTEPTSGIDGESTADERGPDDGQSRDSQSEESGGSDGQLIAQLASELEDGRGSDEDLEALGEQLSALVQTESRGRNSFDARLQRAERELNEVSAYTDALSEFLDKHGSGQEILDELENRTANVQSRLETVAGDVADVDERLEATEEDVEELDERLETAETREERFAERFDAIDERHEETTDRLDAVTDRFDAVDDHIETLEDDLSTLRDGHDEAIGRLDRIEESVEAMDERLDAAEDARDAQRQSLTTEIESIAEDLEEMRNWHRDFEGLLEEFATIGSEATDHEGVAPSEETGPETTTEATELQGDEEERNSE